MKLALQRARPSSIFPKADDGERWQVAQLRRAPTTATLDLVEATRNSSNTVYAQLMQEVGPDERRRRWPRRIGITADLPTVPSLVLGTNEVSVLDMATAYSTFANHGEHVDADRDPAGRGRRRRRSVRPARPERATRCSPPEVADTVTNVLRGVIDERHRHRRRSRRAGGRQDGHDRRQQGRLVRRLHVPLHHGGVDGLPRARGR